MAALTDNKYDVYNWIIKVIDSCETYFHFRNVKTLIINFNKIYDDWELTGQLEIYVQDRHFNRKN